MRCRIKFYINEKEAKFFKSLKYVNTDDGSCIYFGDVNGDGVWEILDIVTRSLLDA